LAERIMCVIAVRFISVLHILLRTPMNQNQKMSPIQDGVCIYIYRDDARNDVDKVAVEVTISKIPFNLEEGKGESRNTIHNKGKTGGKVD